MACSLPGARTGRRVVLQFIEVVVQAVEACFPVASVAFEPLGDVPEGCGGKVAGSPLRMAAALDEACTLEHLEVLRDRRKAHRERLRELGDGGVAVRERGQDRPSGGIRERCEGGAERVVGRSVCGHSVKPFG